MSYESSPNNAENNAKTNHTHADVTGHSGIYLGRVVNTNDATMMGRVQVNIPALGDSDSQYICSMVSSFGGTTNLPKNKQDDLDSDAAKPTTTYGVWAQPPAVGTHVIVSFIPSLKQGFILGTLNENQLNHMMGGRASHNKHKTKDEKTDDTIKPTSEQCGNTESLSSKNIKDVDVCAVETLKTQGLDKDHDRGHSESSARRESPSAVFGITTPGGHVLTMDDGDGAGESNNIRIKTQKGAKILIDDTSEFIFITNHKGSSWIEMDANGNIDIYSKGSISMHTEEDYNIHANGNVNIQADEGVNIKSGGLDGTKIEASTGNIDIYSGDNINAEAWSGYNVTADHYKETAVRIDMNGPVADKATRAAITQLVANTNILASIAQRVPEHHPWGGVLSKKTTFNVSKEETK